jgi:hypothetical protein
MVFEWWAHEYDFFPEIYIEKEQIAGAKITKPCGCLLDV